MKNKEKVPFRTKIAGFFRKIGDCGIRIRKTTEISFSRNQAEEAEKAYSFGRERFISVRDILCAVGAVLAAALTLYLLVKAGFSVAVRKAKRK